MFIQIFEKNVPFFFKVPPLKKKKNNVENVDQDF